MSHMVCMSSEGRVLWRARGRRFFGDTNSDSPPSMVSVFGNCFRLYAGSRAGLGIVWIPSQYHFFHSQFVSVPKPRIESIKNNARLLLLNSCQHSCNLDTDLPAFSSKTPDRCLAVQASGNAACWLFFASMMPALNLFGCLFKAPEAKTTFKVRLGVDRFGLIVQLSCV